MPITPKKETALKKLEKAAAGCRNCGLYKLGTQVVFGTGSATSKVLIVGEQPGNVEDLTGETFVGPAGHMLKACMKEAGLSEDSVYLTNAVKHFKHHLAAGTGKRRLHDKPSYQEVKACHPWLEKQIDIIKPKVVIALGATAARSILNRQAAIGKERGKIIQELPSGESVIVTWHPSAILRNLIRSEGDKMRGELVEDLKLALKTIKKK